MLGCSREALLGPASGSSMVALGAGGVEDPLSGSILKAELMKFLMVCVERGICRNIN